MITKPSKKAWQASVLTLHPEIWPGPLAASLVGRARGRGIWALDLWHLRRFGVGARAQVDARPYGGGPGMVLRVDVVAAALDTARPAGDRRPAVCLSARGRPAEQADVVRWAQGPGLVLLCGRFEGVDARLFEARDIEEVNVGAFVMAGGDVPAMALVEACARLLPGVLGHPASAAEESFADDLLEYPHYTLPRAFEGLRPPPALVSGHHARMRAFRHARALADTRARRPDMWRRHVSATGGAD